MTEPFDRLLDAYARLVVRVGVNVQPGQEVVIRALPEQMDVARALAEECYRVGASAVEMAYADPFAQRAAVRHAPKERLGVTPPHVLEGVRAWRERRPGVITLTGNPHPDLMVGLDPQRLAASQPLDLMAELYPILLSNEIAWTVVGAPTPGWAASAGADGVAELWDAVAVAMRLDAADPVQAWREHSARLRERADRLNERGFDRVRYRGPGTDLTIGLSDRSRWCGGGLTTTGGVEYIPNMPTEEVFISPDWRRAEGSLRSVAPFFLSSLGTLVEDLELELRDGTITQARAARGESEVRAELQTVPRARHLGEVAIVDADSRVAATGMVFTDMLYDENVGSHVAWGNGYTIGFDGSDPLTPEERIEVGLNQASTHVDVVIGSPDVEIDGIHADGTVVPITRGDQFTLT